MANRVGYEKMFKEEMFPHLLTCNFPNLVQKKQTQNLLQFFIEKPLETKNNEQSSWLFFFGGGCVLLGMDGKVKKRSNEHSLTFESAFFS